MSDFNAFMKSNKIIRKNVKYPATKSLTDSNGNALEWELRPITTKINDEIRQECTHETMVNGKMVRKTDTNEYMVALVCASVVYPDLNDVDLQNSYGVMRPSELLLEMVDDAGEFADLMIKVQEISGFRKLSEDVEDAKN